MYTVADGEPVRELLLADLSGRMDKRIFTDSDVYLYSHLFLSDADSSVTLE